MKMRKYLIGTLLLLLVAGAAVAIIDSFLSDDDESSTVMEYTEHKEETDSVALQPSSKQEREGERHYAEHRHPTTNIDPDKRNTVEGVILHHTAEPTVERSLEVLTSKKKGVGTHVVIDTDGTRYVMCDPEVVTFHAGKSILIGREGCNDFTIVIEFQGNTLEAPLTDDQIYSAIEYLRPIIAKYHIPTANIVTHEMIRNAYREKYPDARCYGKVDITPEEYEHFMRIFRQEMEE